IVAPDIGHRDFGFHQRGVDHQPAGTRVGKPRIEAAEAAGRQRLPCKLPWRFLFELLVEVPEVDRRDALEAIAAEAHLAVPDRLPAAAAVFGAFPDDADAPSQLLVAKRPERFQYCETVANLDALDRRRTDRLDVEAHL